MNHHRSKRALVLLVVVVLMATAFAAYSAFELRDTRATCEQLNEVITHTNIQGKVLKRLLMNAADAREASALLSESPPEQRRIDQRAAYLYRLDADLISKTERLKC